MHEIVEVTTTLESAEAAQQLARAIVEKRLAGCVQVSGPIRSIYRWQGEICESDEFRCVFKSTSSVAEKLVREIEELHPYDVPEILIESAAGAPAYANWLREQVG